MIFNDHHQISSNKEGPAPKWGLLLKQCQAHATTYTEEKKYFEVATSILDRVGAYLDMFKLGNEPNLETQEEDLQKNSEGIVPLVRFTERLLSEVVEPWYAKHAAVKRPLRISYFVLRLQ